MTQDNQPIVVNLPEGQNTLTLMQGTAPKQLDELAPVKFEASGTIEAPLRFLEQRVGDIDQHKAHIFVNRDNLSIHLVYNENDAYTIGNVCGTLKLSKVFQSFGINTDKQWALGASIGRKFSQQFALNKQAMKVDYNPNQETADPEPETPGGGGNNGGGNPGGELEG